VPSREPSFVKLIVTGASLEGKESSSYLVTEDNSVDTYTVSANFTFENGQILRIIPSKSGYSKITVNDVACTIDAGIPMVVNAQFDLCFNSAEMKFYTVKATGLQPVADMSVDVISEKTAGSGITVDGVLLKDGEVNVDHIVERNSAHGVDVDGVLLKDSQVNTDQINEKTSATGVTIDSVLLKDGSVNIVSSGKINFGTNYAWIVDGGTEYYLKFIVWNGSSALVESIRVNGKGNTGFRLGYDPTARVHIGTGTATAGTAPIKLTQTSAVLLATPEPGAIECDDGDNLYYTIKTATTRKAIAFRSDDRYVTTTNNSTEYLVTTPFAFADGDILHIIANTSGLSKINVNSVGVKKIYGEFPLYTGFAYDLVYRSTGDGFYALRKVFPYVPTSDDDFTVQWSSIGASVASIVSANRANAKWSVFDSQATLTNPSGVLGGCPRTLMLPDGKVFCVPWNATRIKIFNPSNDTFSTPSAVFSGTTAYAGAVLLPSGKVLMIPFNGTVNPLAIFNPADESMTVLTSSLSTYNMDGTLLPDGKVLITPSYGGTVSYVLDPIADTIVTTGGTALSTGYRSMPVLAPNGKVYTFRYSSTTYHEFDPATNNWTSRTASVTMSCMGNALILSDGTVWIGNSGNGVIYNFDPNTLTFSACGASLATYHYVSQCLLPDGRVFSALMGTALRVIDPITQTIATPANLPLTDANYSNDMRIARHVLLLRDGRVLVSTYNNTNWYLYSNVNAQTNFTNGMLASRVMNKQ
jgi:hypothetical protein